MNGIEAAAAGGGIWAALSILAAIVWAWAVGRAKRFPE